MGPIKKDNKYSLRAAKRFNAKRKTPNKRLFEKKWIERLHFDVIQTSFLRLTIRKVFFQQILQLMRQKEPETLNHINLIGHGVGGG
ncbi:hypothetical protein G9A89_004586 [Geosiphon pyriformis]|nr:hypothetical protein G9A89_004586 [Geosiphon pyriformis]